MPFIDSKITVAVSQEKRDSIKAKLGKAVYVTYHGVNDWGWAGSNF